MAFRFAYLFLAFDFTSHNKRPSDMVIQRSDFIVELQGEFFVQCLNFGKKGFYRINVLFIYIFQQTQIFFCHV